MDHIFLHCEAALELWQRLFFMAGLCWVRVEHISGMLKVDFKGLGRTRRASLVRLCLYGNLVGDLVGAECEDFQRED